MKEHVGKHKLITHLVNSAIIALVSGAWAYIAEMTGLIVWITFLVWAVYFLAKFPLREGIRAMVSLWIGAGAAMLAESLMKILEPNLGQLSLHAPVAISIVVFLVIAFELVPYLVGPAIIIGAATFFGTKLPVEWPSYYKVIVPMFFGMVLCYFTKYLMNKYDDHYCRHHPGA